MYRKAATSDSNTVMQNMLSRLPLESHRGELTHANFTLQQYSELFNFAPVGYLTVDRHFTIIKINHTATNLLELDSSTDQTTLFPLCASTEEDEALQNLVKMVATGGHAEISLHTELHRSRKTPVTLFLQSTRAKSLDQTYCQIKIIDISGRSAVEKQLFDSRDYLQHLASHDELTQLPNRRLFYQTLSACLVTAKSNRRKLGVALLDLNQFKVINDTLGHDSGDELLVKAAQRLRDTISPENFAARLAGDEFILIFRNSHDRAELQAICESVLFNLSQPYELSTAPNIHISASIGVSIYPTDATSADELVKNADIAMYRAKSYNASGVVFFKAEMMQARQLNYSDQQKLRNSIAAESFEFRIQPIYNCSTASFTGVEVLPHWSHPDRGLLPPEGYIKLAEECGAIESFGYIIIKNACKQQQHLQQTGFGHITVSVKISSKQIVAPGFTEKVKETIWSQRADAKRISFILTENALQDADNRAADAISKLHELGIRFALDDFGSGYSSFSQLAKLPIDTIKVDRSIIGGVPYDEACLSIVKALIAMGLNMDISIVATGVETREQFDYLYSAGCDEMQGPLMARAIQQNKVAGFFRSSEDSRQLGNELARNSAFTLRAANN